MQGMRWDSEQPPNALLVSTNEKVSKLSLFKFFQINQTNFML